MSIFEEYGAFKILSGMAHTIDPDQTAPEGHIPFFFQKPWCTKVP